MSSLLAHTRCPWLAWNTNGGHGHLVQGQHDDQTWARAEKSCRAIVGSLGRHRGCWRKALEELGDCCLYIASSTRGKLANPGSVQTCMKKVKRAQKQNHCDACILCVQVLFSSQPYCHYTCIQQNVVLLSCII